MMNPNEIQLPKNDNSALLELKNSLASIFGPQQQEMPRMMEQPEEQGIPLNLLRQGQ